jgi:hypothetical protein
MVLYGFEKKTQKTPPARSTPHSNANERWNDARKKGHIDRSETFDEFLAAERILGETEEAALKQVIADEIRAAMDAEGIPRPTWRRA